MLAFDTETERIRPGLLAPPMACASFAMGDVAELVHHTEAREHVVAALESDVVIVGHNVAYDMAVSAAMWPELLPLIFEVYWSDRVTDTMLREKLLHIAQGIYRKYERPDGTWVRLEYSLEAVARRRLEVDLVKGEWQLRFGELRPLPLSEWPEGAKEYALVDAVTTLAVWEHQEETGRRYLEDEFRQARAGFWLHLMSCWGLHTNEEEVKKFARRTQQKYDAVAEDMIAAGLMRPNGTRNIKAVQERVVFAYGRKPKVDEAITDTDSGGWADVRLIAKRRDGAVARQASQGQSGVAVVKGKPVVVPTEAGRPPTTEKGKPKTDADTCERSGDPVLQKYAELSSLKKTLSTDIPLLESGTHTPIQARFESLLETGRTSSSPNIQNVSTDFGVRECFVPRPGKVLAAGDYSGFELRTWAQVCLIQCGQSEMAKALNTGMDPHLKMASLILKISYEEAEEEFAAEPTGRVYKARQSGKVADFGYPGGLGYQRFVDYARTSYGVIITESEARKLKDFWSESWPEAKLFFDWAGRECEKQTPVLKQFFSNRYRGNLRFTEFCNSTFQGLAADAAKASGFLIARACYADSTSFLYGGRPVDFVHDEFLVEVDDDEYAHDAAMELARLMCEGAKKFLPDVPPKVEPLLARRWSKRAKPVHDANGRLIPWDWKKE